jgi:3'(2'), 5'-bisphosphate nucleotidase
MDAVKALIEPMKMVSLLAGRAIMDIYTQDDRGVVLKEDQSPLTAADKASNAIICAGIRKLDLGFPIVSEENKQIPYSTRKNYQHFWLIDPLDGTKEFIKRNGDFTVNIALVDGTTPILGIVYAPVLEEMYWAVQGSGAFFEVSGETQEIQAPEFRLKDHGLRVVSSRSHMNDETRLFIKELDTPELVSKGSSLKFLMIAKGDADIYPRIAPTMEWDTCAAQCILEEAGGAIYKYGTSSPLKYNKPSLLNPNFVAMGHLLEDKLN